MAISIYPVFSLSRMEICNTFISNKCINNWYLDPGIICQIRQNLVTGNKQFNHGIKEKMLGMSSAKLRLRLKHWNWLTFGSLTGSGLQVYLNPTRRKIKNFLTFPPSALIGLKSRLAWPSARQPINTSIIFGAHFCKVTYKHLPQPLISDTQTLGTLGQLLEFPPCPAKKSLLWGEGGIPKFFWV